jgi:hypothetical protein
MTDTQLQDYERLCQLAEGSRRIAHSRRQRSWLTASTASNHPSGLLGHALIMAGHHRLVGSLPPNGGEYTMLALEHVATTVPGGMPTSAYRHQAWWANKSNSPRLHVGARMGHAGVRRGTGRLVTTVDYADRTATFRKARRVQ